MNIQNAIKKIEKFTGLKVQKNDNNMYWVTGKEREISFIKNGGESQEAICIKVRRKNDYNDSQSDYFAGFFVDNITQALKHFN